MLGRGAAGSRIVKWRSPKEVAELLGYSQDRIARLARSGVWEAYQLPELPTAEPRKRHARPWRIRVDDAGRPVLAAMKSR